MLHRLIRMDYDEYGNTFNIKMPLYVCPNPELLPVERAGP